MIRPLDCDALLDALDALVDGSAAASLRAAAEDHARGCSDCGALLAAASGPPESSAVAADDVPDLAGAVLARTGADPCRRAAEVLGSDRPGTGDRDLLDRHLAYCGACEALARALTGLARDLPALAVPVDAPDLVPAVLRRTLPFAARYRRRVRPVVEAARALARRPRFALEASYAVLVLFLVLFGVPRSVPVLIPSSAHAEVRETAARAGGWIASGATRFARTSGSLARDLTDLLQPAADSDDDTPPRDAATPANPAGDDHERN